MTGDEISVYPAIRRFFKMSGSFSVMLFMVRSLLLNKYILHWYCARPFRLKLVCKVPPIFTSRCFVFLYQICLVLGSVVAVIIYRVIAREDLFKSRGEAGLLMASVTSTFINTLSIMIMGKVCIITSYSCDLQVGTLFESGNK